LKIEKKNGILVFGNKLFNLFWSWSIRAGGRLGPKSLCGNRIYKGHKEIAKIALHRFEKASIPLKMYLKSLEILKKAQFI
jgi:hypothetical protein